MTISVTGLLYTDTDIQVSSTINKLEKLSIYYKLQTVSTAACIICKHFEYQGFEYQGYDEINV